MKVKITAPAAGAFAPLAKLPAALTRAHMAGINSVALGGAEAVRSEMRRAFRNPVPYTMNAMRVEFARADRLQAVVAIKGKQDVGASSVPQQSFLRAQIDGGKRRFKRFELLLWRRGLLARGWYAVPGQGARLDGYGNMSRGQIVELLSFFEAFAPGGVRRNSTAASRARKARGSRKAAGVRYWVQEVGAKGLAPGIYQVQQAGRLYVGAPDQRPRLVVAFVRTATYAKRLPFWETLDRYTDQELARKVDAAIARAGVKG